MTPSTFFSYHDNKLKPFSSGVVREFPLQLIVNKREIATLIASPHDLRFLVAGFLRLQGFVQSLDDFKMFSVCEEFGTANILIKGELPERLKPVLTSGCGTGISFSMPDVAMHTSFGQRVGTLVTPAQIFSIMDELAQRADSYRTHGGIHSAAIGRNGSLLLYAEDIGRHNTLDRIAGEALFKSIDLRDTVLMTSGRVSTELVAKSALLGVRLIASRTSPTDMAITLCERNNICLVGYVKSSKFNVYCHPEQIEPYTDTAKIGGVTGVILAGGSSSRMGKNKAMLLVDNIPIIERSYNTLSHLFHEVIIVTNTPQEYDFIPCRKVPDLYPGIGSIAGLHSALAHSTTERTFVTACDMPFVEPGPIRFLCESHQNGYDAVIPFSSGGQEPLHAVYSATCLETLEQSIGNGERKILDILARMQTRLISWDEIRRVSGSGRSFLNVNTPEEYDAINHLQQSFCEPEVQKKMS
jgi:FdhD protein